MERENTHQLHGSAEDLQDFLGSSPYKVCKVTTNLVILALMAKCLPPGRLRTDRLKRIVAQRPAARWPLLLVLRLPASCRTRNLASCRAAPSSRGSS
jgi:hypothetical protein